MSKPLDDEEMMKLLDQGRRLYLQLPEHGPTASTVLTYALAILLTRLEEEGAMMAALTVVRRALEMRDVLIRNAAKEVP